jgi:hypothetical protein
MFIDHFRFKFIIIILIWSYITKIPILELFWCTNEIKVVSLLAAIIVWLLILRLCFSSHWILTLRSSLIILEASICPSGFIINFIWPIFVNLSSRYHITFRSLVLFLYIFPIHYLLFWYPSTLFIWVEVFRDAYQVTSQTWMMIKTVRFLSWDNWGLWILRWSEIFLEILDWNLRIPLMKEYFMNSIIRFLY